MHAELASERADGPVLGVVQAQDLRLELARDHRHSLQARCSRPSSAPTPDMKPSEARQRHAAEGTTTLRRADSTVMRRRVWFNIDRLAGAECAGRYATRDRLAGEALMRHFRAPRTVTALPLGVATRPTQRPLVASARAAQALAPSQPRALLGAVEVAVIAGHADRHLHPTAAAMIEPIGRLPREPQYPSPTALDSAGAARHKGSAKPPHWRCAARARGVRRQSNDPGPSSSAYIPPPA